MVSFVIINLACVIFIIGSRTSEIDTTLDDKISNEAHSHQDILQAEMVDHYNNLTLKSVMMLKFFADESNFHDYFVPSDVDTRSPVDRCELFPPGGLVG